MQIVKKEGKINSKKLSGKGNESMLKNETRNVVTNNDIKKRIEKLQKTHVFFVFKLVFASPKKVNRKFVFKDVKQKKML